jgi:hypothetical protein
MMRWLEEFELKHVEFVRTIRSFQTLAAAWSTVASRAKDEGRSGFAHRQAAMYQELQRDASRLLTETTEPRFTGSEEEVIAALHSFRTNELSWLRQLAGEEDHDWGEHMGNEDGNDDGWDDVTDDDSNSGEAVGN